MYQELLHYLQTTITTRQDIRSLYGTFTIHTDLIDTPLHISNKSYDFKIQTN